MIALRGFLYSIIPIVLTKSEHCISGIVEGKARVGKNPFETEKTRKLRKISCSIPMTSHGLDAAGLAKGISWLSNKLNWNTRDLI